MAGHRRDAGHLDAQWLGTRPPRRGGANDYNDTAARLGDQGVIDRNATDAIAWLAAFGVLIANDDMHLGNLSMLVRGTAPIAVAPAYDMLPALYAPRHGQVSTPSFAPPIPTPMHARRWRSAAEAARSFWRQLAADRRVSADFRALAAVNESKVARVVDIADRMDANDG